MDVSYVFIMCLPAGRSFTGPFPPGFFAARDLAAVILPPLLFFAMLNTSLNGLVSVVIVIPVSLSHRIDSPCNGSRGPNNTQAHHAPFSLLPQDLLDLTDLFLHFAAYLFVFSFGFPSGIHAEFSDDLLYLAHYLTELAFHLVLRA
jgi:hypothetical protein